MSDRHQHIDLDVLQEVERLLSATPAGSATRRIDDHAALVSEPAAPTLREEDAVTPLPHRR